MDRRVGGSRFLTRDPLEPVTATPYAYANNSPLNFTDPSGEIPLVAAAALAWGAFEVGSAVVDAFSTAKTLTDSCASGLDKLVSGGLFAASVFLPGGGYSTGRAVATARLPSRIGRDARLVREAERAARANQAGLDALQNQLAAGNLNPGIGTKHLFAEIFEARGRDGARVYFRQSGDGIEIVGKSNKANQHRVISLLEGLYGS